MQQRITEKTVGREVALLELELLILVGRHAFQPRKRRDHGQQHVQFGVRRDAGLDEQSGVIRIDPGGQPVHHHVPHALLDDMGFFVMGGQGVPVGHEKEAIVFGLKLDPTLENPVIMPQVQLAGRAHARQDPHRLAGQDATHGSPTIEVTRRSNP